MAIESAPATQPENIEVGFTPSDPEEADIEKQILEAEKLGTSIGEIEDAKQKGAAKDDKPADSKEKEESPDNSETPAEAEARERDEKGRFLKKEDIPDQEKGQKQETDFAKAKKEKERLTKGWNEFEAECKANGIDIEALNTGQRAWKDLERCKNFLRKQIDAATAAEREQLEAERAQMQEQARNRGQFSPQEYQKAAREFHQAAWKALTSDDPQEQAKAKELFQSANACVAAAQRSWEYNLVQARDKDVRETIKQYPELEDINSEAGKAMMQLLKENPYLAQLPNGFSKAAMFLKATRDAARVSELEGQVKTLTEERDEARKQLKSATSLAGAGSQAPPAPQNFDSMSDEEQERAVERMFSPGGEFVLSG